MPEPGSEASPSAANLAQLSDKIDATTVLLEDRTQAVETLMRHASNCLLRHQGAQGQGSLNIEFQQLKQEAVHLAVIRELANNTTLTSEVLRRTADLHSQAL